MKNKWIVFEIGVPGDSVELVSALLAEYGCSGIVVEERELDTFTVPDDELEAAKIYVLKAYFDDVEDAGQLQEELREMLLLMPVYQEMELQLTVQETVEEEDWSEKWKQNFSSFRVGRHLVIKPSWEDTVYGQDDVVIEIDPGMAFGTGTHATTKLCLEAIAELLDRDNPPATMLDVGTGSGLLALGAAALGCPTIVANDIDPVACDVARENVAHNGYAAQIAVTEEPLEELDGRYDLVVANILAEENVRLGSAFMEHLLPSGWLVLSGILREKEGLVRQGFAGFDLVSFPTRYQDDWVCLIYQRKS